MKLKIAKILLDVKAVTLSPHQPYTYSSGIKSPIYCDNRLLISYPKERLLIRDAFVDLIKSNNLSVDTLAGTATAGIPHAAWVADRLNKPMVYVRSKAKSHGKQNQIEGRLPANHQVIIVEDLITTGSSCLEALQAVRKAGAITNTCIAIFTYQLAKAKNNFKQAQAKLYTITDLETLLQVAVQESYINEQERQIILDWQKDPENWNV